MVGFPQISEEIADLFRRFEKEEKYFPRKEKLEDKTRQRIRIRIRIRSVLFPFVIFRNFDNSGIYNSDTVDIKRPKYLLLLAQSISASL